MEYLDNFDPLYDEISKWDFHDKNMTNGLSTLIQSCCDSKRTRIPELQRTYLEVGLKWEFENVYISCWIHSDYTWSYTATKMEGDSNRQWQYNGKCSWTDSTGRPHYFISNDIEDLIVLPEPFKLQCCILNNWEYKISWVTGRYDGPLSGYVQYNNRLCEFNIVEETECERRRLYAIYKLSMLEAVVSWVRYHKWHFIVGNKIGWKVWMYFHSKFPTKYKPTLETRTPIGYFEL